MNTYNIGVIYQRRTEMERFRRVTLMSTNKYSECTKNLPQTMIVEHRYPSTSNRVVPEYKEAYTFHRIETVLDAYDLSGRTFSGYTFCGGQYSADVLNFLQSRIRR